MRNRTSDLRIPRSDTLPLSHRASRVSEVYYEVHMTRVLHTARISNVDSVKFIDRLREMVSFVLGKEIEKDAFRLVTSVGQRKNFESLWLIEPQTFGFRGPRSWQDEKHFPLFLYRVQNLPSPYSIHKQSLTFKFETEYPLSLNEVKADLSVKNTGTI